jgi:bacterioferritin (cytochrome b1)
MKRGSMDKKEIIALLNKDLEDEHGAIGQYLSHAYAMGEGEMSCEIEAIARAGQPMDAKRCQVGNRGH